MISIRKLFEATYAPPAQSPMAVAREYVNSRIQALKRNFALGRIKASDYQEQLKELQRNKNNKLMGTQQF
ncbi:MAG TPA: hypothetical protein PLL26_04610 [Candidatus Dojkabacteria bacterium]|nr:hypothetical protein [Candidatus Dojkabacteria bacterium]